VSEEKWPLPILLVWLDRSSTTPKVALAASLPERVVCADGARFVRPESLRDTFTGFWDWLHTPSRRFVGFEFWPIDHFVGSELVGLTDLPYVRVGARLRDEATPIQVFLCREPPEDLYSTGDQDFGDNVLYLGNAGLVLSLNLDLCSPQELNPVIERCEGYALTYDCD
jgi:hypothetical protein